jgi:hypothetical protein
MAQAKAAVFRPTANQKPPRIAVGQCWAGDVVLQNSRIIRRPIEPDR